MLTDQTLAITGRDVIDNPAALNALLVSAGFIASMLKIEEEDLESFFFRVIGRNGGEA
jgi:hypothetical protein